MRRVPAHNLFATRRGVVGKPVCNVVYSTPAGVGPTVMASIYPFRFFSLDGDGRFVHSNEQMAVLEDADAATEATEDPVIHEYAHDMGAMYGCEADHSGEVYGAWCAGYFPAWIVFPRKKRSEEPDDDLAEQRVELRALSGQDVARLPTKTSAVVTVTDVQFATHGANPMSEVKVGYCLANISAG